MRILPILFLSLLILFAPSYAYAFEAQSDSYRMQMGNFNFVSGSKSSANYQLTDTGGELAIGQSDSASYTTKIGFQYVYTLIPFSFTLSKNSVNFGDLSPQTFYTDTVNLSVSSGSGGGYTVTAIENHQLENQQYSGVYIPDTVGDSSNITPTNAGTWINTSTYGLGYTLTNISGTDAAFTSGYRSFSDRSVGENPVVVMSNTGAVGNSEVQVTYKVNRHPTQQSGDYQNTVTYIMTATF